jgi:asparagine synthetase B (glutamine-hydrolysing)
VAVALAGHIEGVRDAEGLLLDRYEAGGASNLARLRGDYGFALCDAPRRELIVGCDALGLRAPAYRLDSGGVVVSTAAHVIAEPGGLDAVYLAHALAGTWCSPASATAFVNVQRLRGGELIRFTAGRVERLEGDPLVFARESGATWTREETVRAVAEAIEEHVAQTGTSRHCVAWSEGIDSTVVALSVARLEPAFTALTLRAYAADGAPPSPRRTNMAFPAARRHSVVLTGDEGDPGGGAVLADDPPLAGPALEAGRRALLVAARDLGFTEILTGEGGDELFEMVWRPRDILFSSSRMGAFVRALRSPVARRGVLRDFLAWGPTPVTHLVGRRLRSRFRTFRPWLRDEFWRSAAFKAAWAELASYNRRSSAAERIPEILGGYGRHWRRHDVLGSDLGVSFRAPLLHRALVELIGSLDASEAYDPTISKTLLRRVLARRLPNAAVWEPKREPLYEWLVARWASNGDRLAQTVETVRASPTLSAIVDDKRLIAVASRAQAPQPDWTAPLAELATVASWVGAIERGVER